MAKLFCLGGKGPALPAWVRVRRGAPRLRLRGSPLAPRLRLEPRSLSRPKALQAPSRARPPPGLALWTPNGPMPEMVQRGANRGVTVMGAIAAGKEASRGL